MSRGGGRRGRIAEEEYFEASDARIVEIRSIGHALMRTLAAHFYQNHYPVGLRGDLLPLAKAKETWNRDPRFIDDARNQGRAGDEGGGDMAGEFEEEMPDVEAVLDEVLSQDARDFNAQKQDMFDRHQRASRIRAQCLIAYDGGAQRALVSGEWCTLSRSVPLCVRGKRLYRSPAERRRAGPEGELEHIDASVLGGAIFVGAARSVVARDLYELMVENGNFAPAEARVHLVALYDRPSEDAALRALEPEPAPDADEDSLGLDRNATGDVTVASTHRELRQAQQGLLTAHQDEVRRLADRHLLPDELDERRRSLLAEDVRRKLEKAPFIALGLRAALFNADLDFIRNCYGHRVQLEALARGPEFITTLASVLRTEPWVLCIHRLRAEFAAESHVFGLRQLPDLKFSIFMDLIKYFELQCDIGVVAGVDIYHNVLRRDVFGYDTQAEARSTEGHFYYTSGHMFSVFAADRSHYLPQYYHEHNREQSGADLHDPNSLSHSGLLALPWSDHEQPADALDFVALARSLPEDVRHNLRLDLSRMRHAPARSYVALLKGLYWLVGKRVVVVERFVGTGPHNTGRPVDAFFLAQVYDKMCTLTRRLADLVQRAKQHNAVCDPAALAPAALVGLRSMVLEAEAEWRKLYTPAVAMLNQQQRVAPQGVGAESAVSARGAAEAAPVSERGAANTEIGKLARSIAQQERRFAEQYRQLSADAGDGRADVRFDNAAYFAVRTKHGLGLHRTWPLLHVRQFARQLPGGGGEFAAEQIAALESAQREPLVQISGAGGVGKSELIAQICEQYPEDQVMLVAFTGQVASELARRTGRRARTIHSVLFHHVRYLKARNRARAFARARAAKREADGAPDPRAMTAAQVRDATDARDLREYVEHRCGALPPFASPFEHVRVLIVDEISLVEFMLFCRLLDAAHSPGAGRYLEKVVLVGDLNQLPPIGFGSIQSDLAHGAPHSVAQLVVNHRSSGTQLFSLAQAIARHDPELPMPKFTRLGAWRALAEPDGNDVVAFESMGADIADDLRTVYDKLGATCADSETARTTQCLATTNASVNRANETIRQIYFVEPEIDRLRTQMERASGLGGVVQRRREAEAAQRAEIEQRLDEARDTLLRRLPMKIYLADRFFVRKNRTFKLPPLRDDEEPQTIEFYNGRLLVAQQFYDAPRRITRATYCRCGLCPAAAEGAAADARAPCMLERHRPPPARCMAPGDDGASDDAGKFAFHDDRAPTRRQQHRRMAVACDESGRYVELNLETMLVPRAKFGHGFALTTHKMQGSQARYIVYVCTNDAAYVTWKHLYTAITRARDRVVVLSDNDVFHKLVRRKSPTRRSALWLHLHQALGTPLADDEQRSDDPGAWIGTPTPLAGTPRWPEPLGAGTATAGVWRQFENMRQLGAAPPPAPLAPPPAESLPSAALAPAHETMLAKRKRLLAAHRRLKRARDAKK